MRLQKYLAACGVASRRHAEEMIAKGFVQVNGITVREMGTKVTDGDEVRVHGEVVKLEENKHYVMYYKPIGEVTTSSDPEGRPTVLEHFADFPVRLYTVGRLDFDSEGLLLLTNDGDLTARLTHPSFEVDKSYIARVSLELTESECHQLRSGIMIDGRKTARAGVRVLKKEILFTDVLITIHEGRNRQIRRMIEALGHQVLRLKRVKYGAIELGALQRGTWRELSPQEVDLLKKGTKKTGQ
ncbi:MAG: rRNA pseudouridine synthase [Clostridiales bacterium]|nr:rRNA pseudouridine synthase [Clostridiales bacterium]